jgi:CheY-like chemotaxis protein
MQPSAGLQLSEEKLKHLLLQYKYHTAVRRVARGVAHSYNNIFTGLGGQTAMLQRTSSLLGDCGDKRTDLIDELLQRGINQTTVLYDFTRDGAPHCCNQSPLLLANKAIELLNSISRLHRFFLHSEIHQEKIVCNMRDVVLVLFYLGENCVDATPEGGEITLTLCRGNDQEEGLAFRFRDHGPGLPAEQAAVLGTPFMSMRSDSPLKGLGLYAARTLAERYRGRLTFARERDQITLISAIFPLAAEGQKTSPDTDSNATPRQLGNELSKQCFLVVEDDEALRTLLLNRLQRRGHMVFCVNTCAEALEEYNNLHDIITTVLLDIGLWDANGYDCRRKLLTINPQARIILMSGQHELTAEGGAGKSVFLQKPFTMDQLEKAVCDVHL